MSDHQLIVYRAEALEALRRRARELAGTANPFPPKGWSVAEWNAEMALRAFPPLRLRPGLRLHGMQFWDGFAGFGVIVALPTGAPPPRPSGPSLTDGFTAPGNQSLGAAIEGDGRPWALVCAALALREIQALGDRWHGVNWTTETIIDADPTLSQQAGATSPNPDWTWAGARPQRWAPALEFAGATTTFTFFTLSERHGPHITRHVDVFERGSLLPRSSHDELARSARGGYMI